MRKSSARDAESGLPVIMIGAGGHARVLLDLLKELGREVLFITDREGKWYGHKLGDAVVRGADDLILQHAPDEVRLVNAVGSTSQPLARRSVYQRFREKGYRFATLIHPAASVSAAAQLAQGAQVMAGAIIQPGARIGENALINTAASVDHDCVIGAHVHIAPGVTLSGDVRVGDTTHVGTAAAVIQGVRIGERVMIGAGAVVVRDVEDEQKVLGVPARPSHGAAPRSHPEGEGGFLSIMLSAAGRRVSLLKLLRESAEEAGRSVRLVATDVTSSSAAFHAGDIARLVPRYTDPSCRTELLKLCQELKVSLIVPTIDPDLPFYAEHRAAFEAVGTQIMVSSAETVRICNDKQATHDWLVENGFPTVRQTNAAAVLEGRGDWSYPLFVKPRGGSSSVGAQVVRDAAELQRVAERGEFIVQEVAPGREYTVDVYVDRKGRCRCTVPRLRIETRGGEVVKGMTVRNRAIEDLCCRVAEALPGAWGVMNIQVFYDSATGVLNISEINPRFGGGYPLTHQAGAPMTRWIIEEVTGRPLTANKEQWTDGLVMLRYDEAIFVKSHEAGVVQSVKELPAQAAAPPAVE